MDPQSLVSTEGVPVGVLEFPSMMTPEEKALLFRLARDHYTGAGVIVDAGLFLGASTVAFCEGIRSAGMRPGKVVHAYDIALWSKAGFDKYLDAPAVRAKTGDVSFEEGQSYRTLLEALLADYRDLLDLRIGDVVKEMRSDRPVEIAFFDLLKNYDRDWAVFKALGPHYMPGKTFVVQQDYFYEDAIDCKLRQEFLSPYFTFVAAVGSSAVFQCTKAIPASYFQDDPVSRLSAKDRIKLMQQAAGRIPLSKYQMYASLAVVRLMMQSGEHALADFELSRQELVMKYSKLTSPRALQIAKAMRRQINAQVR